MGKLLTPFLAVLAALCLVSIPSSSQVPNFPQVMPAQSLYGNTNPQSGPGFAISLSQLATSLNLLAPATVSVASNAAALAAVSIPSTVTAISTTVPGCSLTYTRGAASPASQYGSVLNTTSGIYWEPVFDTSPVRACQFGTVADGNFNYATPPVYTGTDNTAAIQNALDYAMRNNFKNVCLNDGAYKTTDTLAVGWGMFNNTATAYSLSLTSCNNSRSAYSTFPGVTIYPTKTDRCAINVAGGRMTRINGIHLVGSNYGYANTRFNTANLPIPSTAAGWLDPVITPAGSNPGGLTQFAPFAGFCVDAYNGPQPSPTPYPAQTFPSWINTTTQYNQAGSTDTLFENTVAEGFAVSYSIGTNLGQQNGDFNKIINPVCLSFIYCVSFGSNQSRNGTIQNLNCSNGFTLLTNLQFGQRTGELGGNLTNGGCGQIYQFLDVSLSIAGITLQDMYCEACVRLGNLSGGSITLRNFTFNPIDTITGIVPPAMVEAGNGGLSIRFDDSKITGGSRVTGLVHYSGASGTVTVNGGVLNGGINSGLLFGTVGSQNAVNNTGGYFAGASYFPNSNSGYDATLNWQGVSSATNMTSPTQAGPGLTQSGWGQFPGVQGTNRQIITQAMQGFTDTSNEFKLWQFLRGAPTTALDMSTTSAWQTVATTTTCDTWSGVWKSAQQTSQNGRLSLGDIFYHQTGGTIWVVESIGNDGANYPVVLRQHNNMSVYASQSGSNGGIATLGTITAGSGYASGGTQTFTGVALTGGHGTGATATIVVTAGAVTSVTITSNSPGINYSVALSDVLSASNTNLGGSGSGFSVPVTALFGGCLTNNLSVMPSGNTTLIHVGLPQDAISATVAAGGGSGTPGAAVVTLVNPTPGTPTFCNTLPQFNVTISGGGAISSVNSLQTAGNCPMALVNPVAVTGGGLVGATLTVTYTPGVMAVAGTVYYCDFLQGSNALTNCDRGDGGTGNMTTNVLPGDTFWGSAFQDPSNRWPFDSVGQIATLSAVTAGTATLAGPGALRTGRFPLLPFQVVDGGYPNTSSRGTISALQAVGSLAGVAFASLPASPVTGMVAYVTNGLAASCGDAACNTFGTTVTGGGGSLKLFVWYNGTNWTLMGK